MELKEFISETLTQIAKGVKDAQDNVAPLGAKVNPANVASFHGDIPYCSGGGKSDGKMLCNIEFSVALTNDRTTANGSGIGILFGAVSLGGKHDASDKNTTLTSIKFNVVMELPKQG